MSLTAADVTRIAHLARLELSGDEAARTLEQLNSVFGLIEELRAVDTAGVEPMTHTQDMTLRLRTDQVTEADQRAACQQAAPSVEQGLYLVPRVIE
ncbi:MAG TPA: Asp-tRNA(Asn)/Glu-tRNA(Gln) amidotransferase subunit GatC [Quisquiliibacterium sp.]|nr:Asp-tRNA(Asn)/Glu-tRNA(Gln) amidotransferase subunit GatC [Quisquiliibacterium sp.]HPA89850.1 Asp-tRNA(Asn)/Glu-tRNA(Gln) amidotransferase subunit GatC [Quisquiliibacterium sp.]HQN12718.1 Asp-tRNA(Asn)/Glu-tRNA(Gln) amidotransferase subunit GatC [Quisquiliibacterium sp.]HQP65617.1 Asp-tRNA(Asn)/Glu-tRNA(Gln) amidotransferase subunit GatC [Quisquiliibacterium sp.]